MLPFTIGLTGRVLSIFPSKLTAFPHTIQYLQAASSCALQRQQHLPQLLWLPAETLSSARRAVAFFTARLYSNMPCLLGFYATNWRNLGSFNDYFWFGRNFTDEETESFESTGGIGAKGHQMKRWIVPSKKFKRKRLEINVNNNSWPSPEITALQV